ncbi:hypothetical protein [Burkholderia contaminans]|nr:hypothetical protein [Burkholderia contaminans]MDN7834117.1 hypothetical protein [Burkholderia contaminans]WFF84632.1 hypothetical protein P4E65_11125 [Burkholderia contaminans]
MKAQKRIGGLEEKHASGFALLCEAVDADFRKSTKAASRHE